MGVKIAPEDHSERLHKVAKRVLSSVGRAAPLQGVGRRFEPVSTHHRFASNVESSLKKCRVVSENPQSYWLCGFFIARELSVNVRFPPAKIRSLSVIFLRSETAGAKVCSIFCLDVALSGELLQAETLKQLGLDRVGLRIDSAGAERLAHDRTCGA